MESLEKALEQVRFAEEYTHDELEFEVLDVELEGVTTFILRVWYPNSDREWGMQITAVDSARVTPELQDAVRVVAEAIFQSHSVFVWDEDE